MNLESNRYGIYNSVAGSATFNSKILEAMMRMNYLFAATLLLVGSAASAPAEVLYGLERTNSKLVVINPVTGAVEDSIGLDFNPGGALAIDASGDFFAVDATTNSLVDLNPATGTSTTIGAGGTLGGINGFTFVGNTLFAVDSGLDRLVRVDTDTGVVTVISPGQLAKPGLAGLAAAGGGLLAVDAILNESVLLNANDGTVISSTSLPSSSLNALAIDGNGTVFSFDTSSDNLVTINGNSINTIGPLGSGAGTANAEFGSVHGLAFGPAVIPEPTATAMTAIPLVAIASLRRSRTMRTRSRVDRSE